MQTKMKSLALMLTLALGMPAISQAAPLLADQGEPAAKLARVVGNRPPSVYRQHPHFAKRIGWQIQNLRGDESRCLWQQH